MGTPSERIKTDPIKEIAQALRAQYHYCQIEVNDGPLLTEIIPVFANRCKTLLEMAEMTYFLFKDELDYDEEMIEKQIQPQSLTYLKNLSVRLESLPIWQTDAIHQCIHNFCEELSLGMGKIAQPLRIAVTGTTSSPSIDVTLQLLGKKRTLQHLCSFLINYSDSDRHKEEPPGCDNDTLD